MPDTHEELGDHEIIYRRVPDREGLFKEIDGVLHAHRQAFTDPEDEPSVDIASINGFDPTKTQEDKGDGILRLTVRQVRSITETKEMPDGKTENRAADVRRDPLTNPPVNLAHGVIFATPSFKAGGSKYGQRMRNRLAESAEWEIYPFSFRDKYLVKGSNP